MKNVAYSNSAIKSLRRLPANTAQKIIRKIEQYATDPASQANNVIRMQGSASYRLRVGDWRIIFDEDDGAIAILEIGPRGGIYK
nr:type II toxin-antitoxin system RelE/ParE family toxin [Methylocapsa sp. S129]